MSEKGEIMDKLLLAERDTALRDGLVDLLRRDYKITTCADGRTCLKLLETLRPKAAIIDLTLPELDGLYVIEHSLDFRPSIVLCITDFSNEYLAQTLLDLGVSYVFLKPCFPRPIAARLESLSRHVPSPAHADLQTKTALLLQSLGFAPKSDGYQYLKIALPLYHQDPNQLICKELYGGIARTYGLSGWKPVERSIRSAIHKAWELDPAPWEPYFPGLKKPPTCKAFICQIVHALD